MATSRRNNLFARLCAVCVTGLLGVSEAAQAPCTNQEIVVEAKPMEVDYRNNNAVLREVVITQCDVRIEAGEARVTGGLDFENSRWTISGNVRINADGGKLRSDKAIVSFRNRLISQATITGTPAEFEQQRDDGTTSRGRANTIDYETTNGTVSFRENAWLSDGRNEITGQQLVYNIRSQRVQGQVRPNADGSNSGRVRIVIQPGKPPVVTTPQAEKKP
jgi:lipopolysaccharide export system protein LptA